MSPQELKQRFGIIGQDPALDRALFKAMQVAATDISVMVTGESGVGKESIPRVVHNLSHRKKLKLESSERTCFTDSTRLRSPCRLCAIEKEISTCCSGNLHKISLKNTAHLQSD